MNPMELIAAACDTDIGETARTAVFSELVAAAERSYEDHNSRFEMTSEDMACTYSL
ncbi:hypothetical protein [Stenotrophomonas sp. HMWF023]|uniref:hypothetical protein n=1 Tax=Stenotrophomonas sp. HMWF023 TaxID=2056859 RepID=UPI0015E82DE6|nr:hypothetical protein [Stenotrophomonas sp. HMWF023]